VVALLLDHGAGVNTTSHYVQMVSGVRCDAGDGWTALMAAAKGGYVAVVTVLIGRGADVSLRNSSGQRAEDLTRSEDVRRLLQVTSLAAVARASRVEFSLIWCTILPGDPGDGGCPDGDDDAVLPHIAR
jgi:hypothetical protein